MKTYWIAYIIIVLIILLQAFSDGIRTRGKKKLSKWFEHISIILFFILPTTFKMLDTMYIFNIAILYLWIRIYLFDPIVHLVSGYPINFVGNTSPGGWDQLMSRLKTWQFWVMRTVFLTLSIFWYYKAVINY